MYIFKNLPEEDATESPQSLSCFSISFKLVLLKKKIRLKECGNYPPSLKIPATPLRAVYQHFTNEGSKFRSKAAVKDFQDCDAIL